MTGDSVVVDGYHWKRLVRRRYDILHLHWPEGDLNRPKLVQALPRSLSLLGLLHWARARGSKVIWTIHNLSAHEGFHPRLEKLFWRSFIPCVDGYISLSRAAQREALARFPRLGRVPGFVVPAGHYREAYARTISKSAARHELGIDSRATVLAFVGQVRPYKNIPGLIRAFQQLPDPSAVLLIAGESKALDLTAKLQTLSEVDPRVRLQLEWISDERLLGYLAAADLVVLPYAEVLNSGSALLALSFDRPILVPKAGSLGELQEAVGSAWVRTYTGELTTAELEDAASWALKTPRPAHAPLDLLRWDHIAADTVAAYQGLFTQPRDA
jgi:glycosyltransferase involved in cell wall biosynthesis